MSLKRDTKELIGPIESLRTHGAGTLVTLMMCMRGTGRRGDEEVYDQCEAELNERLPGETEKEAKPSCVDCGSEFSNPLCVCQLCRGSACAACLDAFHHVEGPRFPCTTCSSYGTSNLARQCSAICQTCHDREHPQAVPRDPPAACATDGRCWPHSDWDDQNPWVDLSDLNPGDKFKTFSGALGVVAEGADRSNHAVKILGVSGEDWVNAKLQVRSIITISDEPALLRALEKALNSHGAAAKNPGHARMCAMIAIETLKRLR